MCHIRPYRSGLVSFVSSVVPVLVDLGTRGIDTVVDDLVARGNGIGKLGGIV